MDSPVEKKPTASVTSGKAIASLVLGLFSFCFALLTGIPAIILGALALRDIGRSQGHVVGTGLAVVGMLTGALGVFWTCISVALLLPAVQAAREAARRQVTANNMQQVGLAMHNYHDTYKSLPLRGSEDPAHGIDFSWRVRILPYVEHQPLYDRYDQNRPWDDPRNQPLVAQMPEVYKSPNLAGEDPKTIYLAVVGPDPEHPMSQKGYQGTYPHDPTRRLSFADITDGTSNTIVIVEADADQAKTWMAPEDWQLDPNSPRRGLGNLRAGGFMSLFADGSVRYIPNTADDETLRRLFSRGDGQPVQTDQLQR